MWQRCKGAELSLKVGGLQHQTAAFEFGLLAICRWLRRTQSAPVAGGTTGLGSHRDMHPAGRRSAVCVAASAVLLGGDSLCHLMTKSVACQALVAVGPLATFASSACNDCVTRTHALVL